MLKLAGELLDEQLADHEADLSAHIHSPFQVFVVGQYRANWFGNLTTRSVGVDSIRTTPLIVPRATTFDRIAVEVTTLAAGASARLGIYNDDGAGYPGSLVLDAGTVSVATTGVKAITIDLKLAKGLYWCALVSDGAPTVRGVVALLTPIGVLSGGGGGWQTGYYKAQTYGALPDPFPGGAGIQSWSSWAALLRTVSLD